MGAEPLKTGIFYFIQAMAVQDRDKWAVVGYDSERGQARQEDAALFSCPCHCKKLKLNDSIASFCVSEKPRPSLDEFPLSLVFLLKDKTETKATRICE